MTHTFQLVEATTRDGLQHQGIYFAPKKSGKRALVWVHGLTGRFYGDVGMCGLMTQACETNGWGFASFNNRGHDFVTSTHKVDPESPNGFTHINIGAGYEVFEECVYDIHASVDFLVSRGFSEVFLIGHSTGALKVAYSEAVTPHPKVAGMIISGGLCDCLDPSLDKAATRSNITAMETLIAEGRGDELQAGLFFFPMTPRRYVSLFSADSTEETVFDYGADDPKMAQLEKILKPLFVIVSERDEYLDRPARDVVSVFDAHQKSAQYKSLVFPGANHGFEGKEKEVIDTMVSWISGVK